MVIGCHDVARSRPPWSVEELATCFVVTSWGMSISGRYVWNADGLGRHLSEVQNARRRFAKTKGFAGQLHSSLNGGSLEQGGIDGLMAPAPPLDADDAAPLLDVDTLRDP